jgi:hypothetical protein
LRQPPNSSQELAAFPHAIANGVRFRAHRKNYSPWHFSPIPTDSSPGGRFDLGDPLGTCYVADDIEVAVRERLGPRFAGHSWIPDSNLLEETCVSRLDPLHRPNTGPLADTISKRASHWVTREISTTLDYALTQQWAARFHSAGFTGVKYEPRLSTGHTVAEAWFAPKGGYDLPHQPELNWRSQITRRHKIMRVRDSQIID